MKASINRISEHVYSRPEYGSQLWKENIDNAYTMRKGKYIPSPGINIDSSVNAAFTADKLNAAKSCVGITDC